MTQAKSRLDWVTLLLLALMLAMPAWTVAQSDWAPGLDLLQPTTLVALMLGTLIARSRFRPLVAQLLGLGYGAAWVAFVSLSHLPRAAGAGDLGEQLVALGRHVGAWTWSLIQNGVGKDNFMFLLALLVVAWLLGFLAAWNTFRAVRVLRVVLPAGLMILIDLYYYGGSIELTPFLFLFFAFTLLYLVRVHYTLREREWRKAWLGYDDDVRGAFLRGGSIVTLVAVFVAWAAPKVVPAVQFEDLWRQFNRPLRSLEDSFGRMFSGLQGEGPALTNPFGKSLGFAGARELSDQVLMDVLVHKSNGSALARYWRAGTYDVYTSDGWLGSERETHIFRASASPLSTPYLQRANVKQTFTTYFKNATLLLAVAQPVHFNRDAEAGVERLAIVAGGSLPAQAPGFVDPSFVYSIDRLQEGDAYEVISSLSIADVEALRAAGSSYPDWITGRYLQLPDNFPQRVKALALQIVSEAGATNPFDQATALERWLRRNIAYDEKIEAPAQGQDGVEYVLFESHAGYCDYYASAMVTMARSLGIPARLAVGYARGEFDARSGTYRVRERDAHSWVEVYFPNYGWIEFEPTAAQPLISRPIVVDDGTGDADLGPAPDLDPAERLSRLGEEEGVEPPPSEVPPLQQLTRTLPGSVLALLGVLLGVGAVSAVVGVYVFENRGLRGLRGARWAFARLVRLAAWLRIGVGSHQTPYEQAALLNQAAPDSQPSIDTIAGDFVRETYGRDGGDLARARALWRGVHLRLWWAGVKRRIRGALAFRLDLRRLRLPLRRR